MKKIIVVVVDPSGDLRLEAGGLDLARLEDLEEIQAILGKVANGVLKIVVEARVRLRMEADVEHPG